jgi:hypothetical protein
MQKQKLRLEELKVDSFVTSATLNTATIRGAGTEYPVDCSNIYCSSPDPCPTDTTTIGPASIEPNGSTCGSGTGGSTNNRNRTCGFPPPFIL